MPYSDRSEFEHEERSRVRKGERVRTVVEPDGTEVRLAFPKGRRARGSGRVVSVLRPVDAQGKPFYNRLRPGETERSETHPHSDPSHHIGPCDLACRTGHVPHRHRVRAPTGV